jgi:hypothetical protein
LCIDGHACKPSFGNFPYSVVEKFSKALLVLESFQKLDCFWIVVTWVWVKFSKATMPNDLTIDLFFFFYKLRFRFCFFTTTVCYTHVLLVQAYSSRIVHGIWKKYYAETRFVFLEDIFHNLESMDACGASVHCTTAVAKAHFWKKLNPCPCALGLCFYLVALPVDV